MHLAEVIWGGLEAGGVEPASLALAKWHTLTQAPLDARDALHASALSAWATAMARGGEARVRYSPPERPPASHSELQKLESYFRLLDGYLWLAQRFPHTFVQAERAQRFRGTTARFIQGSLDSPPRMPDAKGPPAGRAGARARRKPRPEPQRSPQRRRRDGRRAR